MLSIHKALHLIPKHTTHHTKIMKLFLKQNGITNIEDRMPLNKYSKYTILRPNKNLPFLCICARCENCEPTIPHPLL